MKSLWEILRGARRAEWFIILVILSLAGLIVTGIAARTTTDIAEQSPLEARLERLLGQIDGAGEVRVMITEAADGSVSGAVVVANALESVRAALEIQSAVQTLLGIDVGRIRIIGRWGGFG